MENQQSWKAGLNNRGVQLKIWKKLSKKFENSFIFLLKQPFSGDFPGVTGGYFVGYSPG
jgi:hypothetical protein